MMVESVREDQVVVTNKIFSKAEISLEILIIKSENVQHVLNKKRDIESKMISTKLV